jgi:hypothetical protein
MAESGERRGVRESGHPSCGVACGRGSPAAAKRAIEQGVPAFGASGTSVCAGCSGVARWGGRAGGDRHVHGAATRLGDRRRSRERVAAWRGTWDADGCSASRSSGARRSVAGWLCGLRSGTSATGSPMRGSRRPRDRGLQSCRRQRAPPSAGYAAPVSPDALFCVWSWTASCSSPE